MAKTKKHKKVKTWNEAYTLAEQGDVMMQKAFVACLSNLGCEDFGDSEHARRMFRDARWKAAYNGLTQTYIGSLVGEYGMSETKAEKEVLAELNAAFDYCEDKDLEWPKKEYRVDTDKGPIKVAAVNRKEAVEIAKKDGHTLTIQKVKEAW